MSSVEPTKIEEFFVDGKKVQKRVYYKTINDEYLRGDLLLIYGKPAIFLYISTCYKLIKDLWCFETSSFVFLDEKNRIKETNNEDFYSEIDKIVNLSRASK